MNKMCRLYQMKVPVVKEVPVPDLSHPNPKYEMLPKHEFTMGATRSDVLAGIEL